MKCDREPATVALANKVKHMAGDLVKLETTPRHRSASNPAERAIQAVEEVRTIRADDAGFLGKVKNLPWDAQDGIVRGSTKKGTCTTTTRFGWREHSEAQSRLARQD